MSHRDCKQRAISTATASTTWSSARRISNSGTPPRGGTFSFRPLNEGGIAGAATPEELPRIAVRSNHARLRGEGGGPPRLRRSRWRAPPAHRREGGAPRREL